MPSPASVPLSRRVTDSRYCFLDPNVRSTPGLHVTYAERETCQPEYRVRRVGFPFTSIELVAEGRGEVILDGSPHPLGPGTLFSYGPNVPHDIITDPDDPMVKYFAGAGLSQHNGSFLD